MFCKVVISYYVMLVPFAADIVTLCIVQVLGAQDQKTHAHAMLAVARCVQNGTVVSQGLDHAQLPSLMAICMDTICGTYMQLS